jgi:hypothetical protein
MQPVRVKAAIAAINNVSFPVSIIFLSKGAPLARKAR